MGHNQPSYGMAEALLLARLPVIAVWRGAEAV